MSHKTVATLTHVGSDVPKEQAVPLLLARIMTKVKLTEGGCWEWQGWKNTVGYPEATLGGKRYMVHRFMYEALTGGIAPPRGMDICHSCHNRACINPYHIRQDTHHANLMESSRVRRLNGQGKTHCKRGHLLEGDNLSPYTPFRSCRICERGRYRLRLGWPEDKAFMDIIVPGGYMLDRKTGDIVPAKRKLTGPNSAGDP